VNSPRISNPEASGPARSSALRDAGPRRASSGTVLAFDFGTRRVGVAIGELALGIAHPLQTISTASDRARLEKVGHLVRDWSPVLLVVGLPTHGDRSEHVLSARCRRFALQLERTFEIHTQLVDERLTSRAARESLVTAGIRGRRQKGLLDQLAAVHILQTYFSAR